jgi:antitoxin StbD
MEALLANCSVSVTELKQSPSAIIDQANGQAIAVLNHNRPAAYLVPAATYAAMVERLDDLELAQLVRSRASEPSVVVDLNDL